MERKPPRRAGKHNDFEANEDLIQILDDMATEACDEATRQTNRKGSVVDLQAAVLKAASDLVSERDAIEVAKAALELITRLEDAQ